jgi:hypothetical protein
MLTIGFTKIILFSFFDPLLIVILFWRTRHTHCLTTFNTNSNIVCLALKIRVKGACRHFTGPNPGTEVALRM